jgi:hypothetical protein
MRENLSGFPSSVLVVVRPAPVAFEDDLAALAPEHDLKVAPSDRGGIAATNRAGRCLGLERRRKRIDLDL